MGYNDHTEFPRGSVTGALSGGLAVGSGPLRVAFVILVSNNATGRQIDLRDADDTYSYVTLTLNTKRTRFIPGFYAPDGLLIKSNAEPHLFFATAFFFDA
jgi:hypothetical protein